MPAEHLHAVPHLTTALSGPLQQIETLLLTEQVRIETWLPTEWRRTPAPIHTSVELRNAKFKLAPVDTNLLPAGFDNFNPAFLPVCVLAMQIKIEQLCETASNSLLIPEDHSHNLFYLENLAMQRDIILKAGYQVRIGSLRPDLKGLKQITLPSGRLVQLDPLIKPGRRVGATDYAPWLINPLFRNCGELDIKKREGADCLVRNVEALLEIVQKKYDEYGIDKPNEA